MSFLAKFNVAFLKKFVVEVVETAAIAGALGGLTVLGNDIPVIADHYGFSPLFTMQIVALVGAARAFISGLNSVKQTP